MRISDWSSDVCSSDLRDRHCKRAALACTTGIILGAAYMLYLYRRIVFGELTKDDVKAMPDIKPREWAIFVPLAAVALWMGIYPESFLAPMRGDVTTVVARLRSEEHTSELQSLMRISYAVFCLQIITTLKSTSSPLYF